MRLQIATNWIPLAIPFQACMRIYSACETCGKCKRPSLESVFVRSGLLYKHDSATWRAPPAEPATSSVALQLTWMGINNSIMFFLTWLALLDLEMWLDWTYQILIVRRVILWGLWCSKKLSADLQISLSQSKSMGKSLFGPNSITWHCNYMVWLLCQIGFTVWHCSWGLEEDPLPM